MTTRPGKLPGRYVQFQKSHPEVFLAYQRLGEAIVKDGPLSAREIALVKLGIAAGARMEGAVHSHCRRALEAGVTSEEIRHVILLSLTTTGFPAMMAAMSWADDLLANEGSEPR